MNVKATNVLIENVKADDENDNIKTAYSKIKVFEDGELPKCVEE